MEVRNILILDEQPVVKEGLESFFAEYSDINIVADADNVMDCLDKMRQTRLDVVLMDLALPDVSGKEAIRILHEENQDIAIIIYTDRKDEVFVFQALKAGARGYLLKSTPMEEVLSAIRRINMDEYILSPELSPTIIGFYLKHREMEEDSLGEYQKLTDREKQVFRLLANGEETQGISGFLCISPKTVAKHRTSIKKKLSLDNAVEMAQYAIRIGILDQEDFAKEPEQRL